jgi:hypothetical protein
LPSAGRKEKELLQVSNGQTEPVDVGSAIREERLAGDTIRSARKSSDDDNESNRTHGI